MNEIFVFTGLTISLFRLIHDHLKWDRHRFDFVGIAEEIGAGRPDPKMLLVMMEKFKLHSSELLKVGDTVSDVEEGKNAGVVTAALLAGTQDEAALRGAYPDFVLMSLSEITTILQ